MVAMSDSFYNVQGMSPHFKSFRTLSLSPASDHAGVVNLCLAQPKRGNAVSLQMVEDIIDALEICNRDDPIKAVILMGLGKNFCAGLDFATMQSVTGTLADTASCPAESRAKFRQFVLKMQAAMTAFELCTKPVIAAVHGACVGAGVDMITACDIRLCTEDARFCVKEVDLAITADLGTLQRLPFIVGEGRARHLALTAKTISGQTAHEYGLVTQVCSSRKELETAAVKLASEIAQKPTLAVQGTKQVMLHGRGRRVEDGLEHVALWNSAMLWSHQLEETVGNVLRTQADRQTPAPLLSKL